MNSTSLFSTVENSFRNLFNLPPIKNSLNQAELKKLLSVDALFNQLHQRIEEGADLESPKLIVFEYKTHTITLLNYTSKDVGFDKKGCIYCKENSSDQVGYSLEFAKVSYKVIAYSMKHNPEVIFFEQQDIHQKYTTERLFAVPIKIYYWFVKRLDIPEIVFSEKKEHQKDGIMLLIKASRFDANSAFNIVPMDIIIAIFARYEDALKKESPSRYINL